MADKRIVIKNVPMDITLREFVSEFSTKYADKVAEVEVSLIVEEESAVAATRGSITSVQAIYVPADDLTDPAPASTFAHLDATTVLSR